MTKNEPAGGADKKYHPPSGKSDPRKYRSIKDGAPAAELGEYLRAIVRDSDITLDTISRLGGIAKNTFTTTMDGRAKPWSSVEKWIEAFTHPDVKGTCSDDQREEIKRRYDIGQENKRRQNAAAKAARKPVEKTPDARFEVPATADPRAEKLPGLNQPLVLLPQFQPQKATIDVDLPRRIPGARIDPDRRAFLGEADVAARRPDLQQSKRWLTELTSALAGRIPVRAVKAVVTITDDGPCPPDALAMPRLCVLDDAEIAEHVGRPTTHLHSSWSREKTIGPVFPCMPSAFYAVRAPGLPSLPQQRVLRPVPDDVARTTVELQEMRELLDLLQLAKTGDQLHVAPTVTVGPVLPAPHIRRAAPARPAPALPAGTPRGPDWRRARARSRAAIRARTRWAYRRWIHRRRRSDWTSDPPTSVAVIIVAVILLVVGGSLYILAAHFWPSTFPPPP